jgi:hypothetical protein
MDRISDQNSMYIIHNDIIDDDLMEQSLELEHWMHIAEDDGLDNFSIEQEV